MSAAMVEIRDIEPPEPSPQAGTWDGEWPQTPREFEQLVEAFQDRLVSFAYRRLGDFHDAEDVAQEVFVRAYTERRRLRGVVRVGAYLYRMAANLCTDFLRKRKQSPLSLDEAVIEEIPSAQPDGLQAASSAEELQRIEGYLSRLPHRQAEVVRFRVLGELRLNEIADTLECPLPTVKSRLRYGLEKLREIILRERRSLP